MIDLWFWPTPNGYKASIALEEMGYEYRVKSVNILKGEQFAPEFLAINPNHKIPAIVDHDTPSGKPRSLFESGAILMYLAEKSGKFWPEDFDTRYDVIQWLMFQMGNVGPMFGQNGHFQGYANEDVPYAKARYLQETERLYGVMDGQLAQREYIAGDYSLADMAIYPWTTPVIRDLHRIDIDQYPNVKRWHECVAERPAVQRGEAVMRDVMKIGDPDDDAFEALFGKHETR